MITIMCRDCGLEKEKYKGKRCIDCYRLHQKHYNEQYKAAHKEEITKQRKQYRVEHKEELNAKSLQHYYDNKETYANNAKMYRENNAEHLKEYNKQWANDHRDERKKYHRRIRQNNKEEYNQKARVRSKKRRSEDPAFRLRQNISTTINKILKANSSSKRGQSILQYLPYSIDELFTHLTTNFEPWMTWDNQGLYDPKTWNDNDPSTWKWQLDHIIPQSDLPYTSMEDENFKKCWALENLRPYSAKINVIDGGTRIRHRKKDV